MPITGKVHQPPPVHQVFEGNNFVICNFVPRKVDYHPLSIPVPYYHSNVDRDEVMFYCGGDYEARKGSGIGQGSVSLHPGGHSHGPQPGAYERSIGVQYFDELAVMVDTFRPLRLGEGGRASDDGAYAWSWSGRGPGEWLELANLPVRVDLPYGCATADGASRRRALSGTRCSTSRRHRCRDAVRKTAPWTRLLAAGPDAWACGAQRRCGYRSSSGTVIDSSRSAVVTPVLPFAVADYVDFYASEHHATNVGPHLPARTPIRCPRTGSTCRSAITGGRARSSCRARRSCGRTGMRATDGGRFGPSARLDFEAEVAFVVGVPRLAHRVPPATRRARLRRLPAQRLVGPRHPGVGDVPLGPFLGKSFATSVSPWITPLRARRSLATPPPRDRPTALPRRHGRTGLDIDLEVAINGTVVSRPPFAGMYWTYAQMLAHLTSNGAAGAHRRPVRIWHGERARPDQRGCLLELTWNGTEPMPLGDGASRTWLEDGDEVVISAPCGLRSAWPRCAGRIAPE